MQNYAVLTKLNQDYNISLQHWSMEGLVFWSMWFCFIQFDNNNKIIP